MVLLKLNYYRNGRDMTHFSYDYEYLLHLLYCFIHGEKPSEKPDNISFERVFELGKIHEVANIAFLSVEMLENKPDDALYNEWKIYYYFSVERDSRQEAERERIINALHESGIRTLEAQGTVTKKYYPQRELRMMSDIDIIVDYESFKKAEAVLEKLGYEINEQQEFEIEAENAQKLIVEFHADFFTEFMYNRAERYSKAINKPFEHAKPNESDPLTFDLDDTYFYFYSLLHTIKHFEVAGCGIRRILDLYYLKKAFESKIDNDLVSRIIDENGFRPSYETLFAVERLWFENEGSELDLTEAINDIIISGNHGAAELFTRNNIRKDRQKGVKFARINAVLHFIFQKKKYIYLSYPELEEQGRGYLYCWFYRLFKSVKRMDFSHAKNYLKTIIKSK